MNAVLSSLISGTIGVLIGSIIQIIYMQIVEKRHLKDDYKKICVSEWLSLTAQTFELINAPKDYNHNIFNQYEEQKIELLKFITHSSAVDILVENIKERHNEIELGDYAEAALNRKKNAKCKAKLMRDISALVTEVVSKINGL